MNKPKNRPNRTARWLAIGAGIVAALIVLALAYVWISGGSGEASTALTAPTLAPATTREATAVAQVADETDEAATEEVAVTDDEPTDEATQETAAIADTAATEEVTDEAPVTDEAIATVEAAATDEATEAASADAITADTSSSAEVITYSIVPEESLVSFELDEDLRGQRVTVLGTTNQVAGQVRVDFANPAASQVGVIRINLRTLATDQQFRDRAIRGQILLTAQDEYEFTDFVPTELSGLPETATIGESITFQITGDLTLRGITQSVTFDTTVTAVSETRLEGTATTTINRADYELNIPSVPSVANVEEEVVLTINFVAVADGT